ITWLVPSIDTDQALILLRSAWDGSDMLLSAACVLSLGYLDANETARVSGEHNIFEARTLQGLELRLQDTDTAVLDETIAALACLISFEDMLHAMFINGMPAFSIVNETDYAQEYANLSESVGSVRSRRRAKVATSLSLKIKITRSSTFSPTALRKIDQETWKPVPYLLLWILLTGGAVSPDALERSYFTTQDNRVATGSGLHLWNDIRKILSNFLCLQRSLREDTCDASDLSYDLSAPTDPQLPDQVDRHALHSRAVYAEQNYTSLTNNAAASPFLHASLSVLYMN
ncbi:hypothetical protein LTR04_001414, partial [Oleoguttula sp. CCFEE 6159]